MCKAFWESKKLLGQLTFDGVNQIVNAALDGYGIGFVPDGMLQEHFKAGRLVPLLEDWCPSYLGYHLYYPSRRQPSAAFEVVLEALRAKR